MNPVGNLEKRQLTSRSKHFRNIKNLLGISAGLAVNLDEPLLEDSLDLLGVEGVLQTVPE